MAAAAAAAVLFSTGRNTGPHPRPCGLYIEEGGGGNGGLGGGGGGALEAHAFIIKVSWEALQHLEVLKRALLREYVGIAHARKLATLPTDVRSRRCGAEGGKKGGGGSGR